MTNKLPVVGKRYRSKITTYKGENFRLESIYVHQDKIRFACEGCNVIFSRDLEEFWDYFEELPEDKAEMTMSTKRKCKNCDSKIEGSIITSNGCCSAFCAENLAKWQEYKTKPEAPKTTITCEKCGKSKEDNRSSIPSHDLKCRFCAEAETKPETQIKISDNMKEAVLFLGKLYPATYLNTIAEEGFLTDNPLFIAEAFKHLAKLVLENETKSETQSHISELSPEVKEAMETLKYHAGITNYFDKEMALDDIKDAAKRLSSALDKQFMSKKEDKIDIKQEYVDSIKVNETSKSVDVKEEEVKEKEFFWAAVGQLIEYQGKKYICISQTNYLPNERAEDWKEEDHTSQWCKHTKIKFRDIFANNKIKVKEVADNKALIKCKNNATSFVMTMGDGINHYYCSSGSRDSNKEPNEETLKSFSDYEKGIGLTKHDSVEELFEDLEEESIWTAIGDIGVLGLTPEQICIFEIIFNSYEKLKERVKKLEKVIF